MAGILLYSEKENLALELLTLANSLAGSLDAKVNVITINNDEQAQRLADMGAYVLKINHPDLPLADVEGMASTIAQAVKLLNSSLVLLSSDRRGKELAGRLAQVTGAGCLTDVIAAQVCEGKIHCQRNTLGGTTIATQYLTGELQVLAITPKCYPPAAGYGGSVTDLYIEPKPSRIKVLEIIPKVGDDVDIDEAQILVAVGQGLNSQSDLPMLEKLASLLGGEIACTKPIATDKKWLPENRVIGLSGKICKPELAILLGISGQIQFTVGIRDAKTIVAINSDENAAINQLADYILTGDLHEVVPALNQLLGK